MATTLTTVYSLSKFADGDTGWGSPADGNMDTLDGELAKPRIIYNSPTVGATTTCDLSLGRVFKLTVSQVTTLAFTNVPTSAFAVRVRLQITNGAAFAVTWPGSVSWLSGTAPTLKTAGVDEVEMMTTDGGTTWYASLRADARTQVGTAAAVARPSQVLYQNGSLTTTSTSDVSLASYSLPANALSANFQQIRITIAGIAATQNCSVNVKFGSTIVAGPSTVTPTNKLLYVVDITRTGAATETEDTFNVNGSTVGLGSSAALAENLANAVLIDFRGSVTAGGTWTYDYVRVERLAV